MKSAKIYQKDVFSINYDKLLKQNIKNLLFDIDNTIASGKDKLPSKEIIELFIVPEVYIHIKSDKNTWGNHGDVIKGMLFTVPVPIQNSYTISNNSVLEHKNSTSGTYLTSFKPTIEYSYYSSKSDNVSEINSTTIAEDGIVHRTNDYVFGLGYSKAVIDHSKSEGYTHAGEATGSFNENGDASWNSTTYKTNIPVLFYHKVEPIVNDKKGNYYKDPKDSGGLVVPCNESYTNKGFAQRIHAIPLEDIFNAIKHMRENDSYAQFGL